jgi:hypothetical protein
MNLVTTDQILSIRMTTLKKDIFLDFGIEPMAIKHTMVNLPENSLKFIDRTVLQSLCFN